MCGQRERNGEQRGAEAERTRRQQREPESPLARTVSPAARRPFNRVGRITPTDMTIVGDTLAADAKGNLYVTEWLIGGRLTKLELDAVI